eukprot:6186889-Pleurochrysis_carterae.AAC.2
MLTCAGGQRAACGGGAADASADAASHQGRGGEEASAKARDDHRLPALRDAALLVQGARGTVRSREKERAAGSSLVS